VEGVAGGGVGGGAVLHRSIRQVKCNDRAMRSLARAVCTSLPERGVLT
jgi:hypothetical protein